MHKYRLPSILFLVAVILGSFSIAMPIGAQAASAQAETAFAPGAVPPDLSETMGQLQKFSDAFASVAARVQPGVVTVFSEKVIRTAGPYAGGPFQDFFNDPFFHRFFQIPQGEQRQKGLGSGVIVSKDGYILTNNHVVDDADKVSVDLGDGQKLDAKVVGTDPKADLAVLKIKAGGLPALQLGDSDNLKVGEWVLAVGNPFGLQHTVTYGIVSAVGRGNVGLAEYEDFIQTDAAINPGNSGGALVNLQGEVVGINTAIVTRSGGYQGIGFAIPINMARNIMKQLIEHGKVTRGFLGVSIQEISPDMADAMGLKTRQGVVVAEVNAKSPADRAGLKREDVILALNGDPVKSTDDLRNRIAQLAPGTEVRLHILRGGREKTVRVVLGELPQEQPTAEAALKNEEILGIQVQALTRELAGQLGYTGEKGVLITRVQPGSVAYSAGLRQGDLIREINRQPVKDLDDYEAAMEKVKAGNALLLLIRRRNHTFFVALRLPG